jgi:hypothetical protein
MCNEGVVIGGVKIGRRAEPHIRIGFYIPTIRYYNSKMSTTDTTYEALIAKLLETSGARVFRRSI